MRLRRHIKRRSNSRIPAFNSRSLQNILNRLPLLNRRHHTGLKGNTMTTRNDNRLQDTSHLQGVRTISTSLQINQIHTASSRTLFRTDECISLDRTLVRYPPNRHPMRHTNIRMIMPRCLYSPLKRTKLAQTKQTISNSSIKERKRRAAQNNTTA